MQKAFILMLLLTLFLAACATFSIEPDDGRNITPPTFRFHPYQPPNDVDKSTTSVIIN